MCLDLIPDETLEFNEQGKRICYKGAYRNDPWYTSPYQGNLFKSEEMLVSNRRYRRVYVSEKETKQVHSGIHVLNSLQDAKLWIEGRSKYAVILEVECDREDFVTSGTFECADDILSSSVWMKVFVKGEVDVSDAH